MTLDTGKTLGNLIKGKISMHYTVKYTTENELHKKYPIIKKSNTGCIVLFNRPKTGVCLHPGSTANCIGESSGTWNESAFTEIVEEITLSVKR